MLKERPEQELNGTDNRLIESPFFDAFLGSYSDSYPSSCPTGATHDPLQHGRQRDSIVTRCDNRNKPQPVIRCNMVGNRNLLPSAHPPDR